MKKVLSKKIVFTNLSIVTILFSFLTYIGFSTDAREGLINFDFGIATLIFVVITLLVLALKSYQDRQTVLMRSYLWSILFTIISFVFIPLIFGVLLSVM